jgi:tetratricopeptide (TPR) repeat protein
MLNLDGFCPYYLAGGSVNAHDSLGEAYMIMGDKEKAIKFYKLAVELNPGDTPYAKRVLQNSKDKLRELGVEK